MESVGLTRKTIQRMAEEYIRPFKERGGERMGQMDVSDVTDFACAVTRAILDELIAKCDKNFENENFEWAVSGDELEEIKNSIK